MKSILEDLKYISISCRNVWDLRSYDINEAGQVFAYLVDLRNLPYAEQTYWKSYNEPPKAPISKRAYTTDFMGDFDKEYCPLNSLKWLVQQLHKQDVFWWELRSDELIEQIHYPVTNSKKEWADELHALDKLLVDGLKGKWLRKKAETLGQQPKKEYGSIYLIEECLIGLGYEPDRAQNIVSPLRDLHNLRTKLAGHASGSEAVKIRQEALSNHKTFRKHFEKICADCDSSMRDIAEAFAPPADVSD